MADKLIQNITISRQFLRSINLEADLGRSDALNGYVCQNTALSLVKNMAHHLNETRQRAFTWTGPYGGGKSSLALVLGSLVSPNTNLRNHAKKLLSSNSHEDIGLAWKSSKDGWLVLPIVGKRDSVVHAISAALDKVQGTVTKRPKSSEVILRLVEEAEKRKNDGVLLILDELGKFLESASQTGEDIYFYQELAEMASRCNGKLVIVGILHQAFEQYAVKLGREARDEWAKIQGRYIDIPLVVGTDEVIELVGRSIEKTASISSFKLVNHFAEILSQIIVKRRPNSPTNLKQSLVNCWPLHPVTASLLGPISRKKFSQNERSVFGFLASAEPLGFTDFLHSNPNTELALYSPARYWDYLKINMEQAILASSDGHRWVVANDAIERTEAREGCTEVHLKLAKTIALIEMFKANSGVAAEDQLLEICVENTSIEDIRDALNDLARWSIIVFRKHISSWTIYSGSDFDIDSAVNTARSELGEIDVKQLIELTELNPIVAKSHYHLTGTLRWFNRTLIHSKLVSEHLNKIELISGAIGEFILVVPDADLGPRQNKTLIKELSSLKTNYPVVLGFLTNAAKIFDLGMELSALERVQKTRRELESDSIAKKEINGRISYVKNELSDELKQSFETAVWFHQGNVVNLETKANLSSIASKLALETYPQTIRVLNELVNKESISGNAVKARRELMYRMINRQGESLLGYEGFSSDAGIFYSVIQHNNLYQLNGEEWAFITSDIGDPLAKQFKPLWDAADLLLKSSKDQVTLTEIYKAWKAPPIGARNGLLPLFALVYFLANRHQLGLYIEKTFIPDLTEAYLDEWMQDTNRVAFKYVEIGKKRESLLRLLSSSLSKSLGKPVTASPLESARGLVNVFASLPNWTKRTSTVSPDSQKLRTAILRASDPHKVLFSDLPNILETDNENILVDKISFLTKELQTAYPNLLDQFKDLTFKALDHRGDLSLLLKRAENIKGKSGDFGTDAFIARLSVFKNDQESLEGLLSTTINKNPKDWVDRDVDAAINKLGGLCSSFRQFESLNVLRGNASSRQSFAFVYSDPENAIVSKNFDVANEKLPELKQLSKDLLLDLYKKGLTKDEILATFAQACNETINS
jgi:hypothetical protein